MFKGFFIAVSDQKMNNLKLKRLDLNQAFFIYRQLISAHALYPLDLSV